MAIITEDYVSFEVAKLLKEKWFDQNCATYYLDGQVWRHYHSEVIPKGKQIYADPTQALAMKWLREVHKKWITITFHWYTIDGKTTLYYSPYIMLSEYENVVLEDENPFKMKLFNSYEEACEEACVYALKNLI